MTSPFENIKAFDDSIMKYGFAIFEEGKVVTDPAVLEKLARLYETQNKNTDAKDGTHAV